MFKISGSLDMASTSDIYDEIGRLIERREEVVVDASELDLIDSSGIAALVRLLKGKRAQGVACWMEGLRDQPLAFLKLSRLDQVFKLPFPRPPSGPMTVAPPRRLLLDPIDRLRMVSDVSERLLHAKQRGVGATLLLGAGCSVTANVPMAAGVAVLIAERYPKSARRASRREYGALMQVLEIGERHDVIAGLVAQARVNATHEIVADLVKEGFVDRILTTNFDGLVLKACLRAGVQIYDYDLSDMRGYEPGLVRTPALFFLHGRDGGFLQFHTEPEMLSHAPMLAPVIRDAVSHRPLVVVGYSGMDPIFNVLVEKKQYTYGLFWAHYGDTVPSGRLLTELIMLGEGTYFILAGGGSDDFFSQLAGYVLTSNRSTPK